LIERSYRLLTIDVFHSRCKLGVFSGNASHFRTQGDLMANANFNGVRVLSLESRRAAEASKLIRTYGGEPLTAPAMREVPISSDGPVIEFARALMAGAFDLVIFTTGVGVRALIKTVSEHMDRENFLSALRKVKIAARGPKSSSALREFGIPISVVAPEPFTWHALVQAIEKEIGSGLKGTNVAVQEYGVSNPELIKALTERSASITRVPVYEWALPEDVQPLREAVIALAHGRVDVVLFMNAGQVAHLFLMAERMRCTDALYDGFCSTVIASIGPSTTEGLGMFRLAPDFEPSQSKMGIFIKEVAENAEKLLKQKRAVDRPK
jgi:uroporphyrinogen-III synthase